jgi:predicted Zn-dependent peptidase
MKSTSVADGTSVPTFSLPKCGQLAGKSINSNRSIEVIEMAEITGSYLSLIIPIDIVPGPLFGLQNGGDGGPDDLQLDFFLGIALLCQLVSYTEGPLYRRIRGAGLAYGASLSLSLWNGLLAFDVSDSVDPVGCLQIVQDLISELISESQEILRDSQSAGRHRESFSLINAETIRTAQAAHLYGFVAERSTPAAIYSTALRCYLRGLPAPGSPEERKWNQQLLSLQAADVARAALQVLPSFLDWSRTITLLTVPSNVADAVTGQLTARNITFVHNEDSLATRITQ